MLLESDLGHDIFEPSFRNLRDSKFGLLSGGDNPLANRLAYTAQQDYRLIKSAYRLDACTY